MYNIVKYGLKMFNKQKEKNKIKHSENGDIACMCPECFDIMRMSGSFSYDFNIPLTEDSEPHIDLDIKYICKSCTNIVNGINLDPNIAKAIGILNKKGYKTLDSCEGHNKNNKNHVGIKESINTVPYIIFDSSIQIFTHPIPDGWYLSYIDDESGIIMGYYGNADKKSMIAGLNSWVNKLEDIN